jgi:hypothetical protein
MRQTQHTHGVPVVALDDQVPPAFLGFRRGGQRDVQIQSDEVLVFSLVPGDPLALPDQAQRTAGIPALQQPDQFFSGQASVSGTRHASDGSRDPSGR